jgi:hypothetical protein
MNIKNCKENQIFNKETKKCVKKDSKKGIELLFNMKDSNTHKLYEIIDGKIVKKCEKDKIRNPKTKRCIKKIDVKSAISGEMKKKIDMKSAISGEMKKKIDVKSAISKKMKKKIDVKSVISGEMKKKIEAIKRVKEALIPFINRVSADVYHRNRYLVLMKRELKNKKKGCLRLYKKNPDDTYTYRIGNKIILKKRIGTDSVYGIVYLSEFRDKNKKLFTFASKIYKFDYKKTSLELAILINLTEIVRKDICPHFPLFYGYVTCDKFSNNDNDSYVKSNSKDLSLQQDINLFPKLIQQNLDKQVIIIFNELANGDLWTFMEKYNNNVKMIINSIIQNILSIIFFNYHISRVHTDTHPGNFLFHKISPGGYFHYNLFGKDYYLENLGILWVLWDFDLSLSYDEAEIKYNNKAFLNDFSKLYSGYLYILGRYPPNNVLIKFISSLQKAIPTKYKLNIHNISEYIYVLAELINKFTPFFPDKLPNGATIINKKPYVINNNKLNKLFI